VNNKRYTLAVRRLTDGDTASDVLAEFLGLLNTCEFDVKAVYLDSGFYDGKCLTLLQAHNFAYVLPIIRWGNTIKAELNQGWSREIEHDLTTEFDGHEWTVEFLVYIDCTYKTAKYLNADYFCRLDHENPLAVYRISGKSSTIYYYSIRVPSSLGRAVWTRGSPPRAAQRST
jgi:hypothetical protein